MPWSPGDSYGHTHKANSAGAKAQWSAVANSVLAKTGDDAAAVRIANGVIKKRKRRRASPVDGLRGQG